MIGKISFILALVIVVGMSVWVILLNNKESSIDFQKTQPTSFIYEEESSKIEKENYPQVIINDPLLELDREEFQEEYKKLPDNYEFEIGIDKNVFKFIFNIKIKDNKITKKEAEKITAAYPDEEIIEIYPTAMKMSWKGFRYFPNIKSIGWYGSELRDIGEVKYLSKLEYFDIYQSDIGMETSTEELQGLANMKKVDIHISSCQLPDIEFLNAFKNIDKESVIDLSANSIKDITPLFNLKEIKGLYLSGNQITDISPLSSLENIKELELSSNKITDISSISALKNLQKLWLNDNKITNISPLSNLREISFLCMDKNQISDLSPLLNLKNLDTLWIENNKIEDISILFDFPKLKDLNVKGNPIVSRSQIERFITKKKREKIEFEY